MHIVSVYIHGMYDSGTALRKTTFWKTREQNKDSLHPGILMDKWAPVLYAVG